MKNHFRIMTALALLFLAGVAAAQFFTQALNGVRIGDVYAATSGTKINRVEIVNLSFAGDTSKTATVTAIDSGAAYYVLTGWKTCSANQAKPEVAAISGTTLTATVPTATTGTLTVAIFQTPA